MEVNPDKDQFLTVKEAADLEAEINARLRRAKSTNRVAVIHLDPFHPEGTYTDEDDPGEYMFQIAWFPDARAQENAGLFIHAVNQRVKRGQDYKEAFSEQGKDTFKRLESRGFDIKWWVKDKF